MTRIPDTHYDPDLELDFMDIATSVARQSSLYGYYSELAVDARAERDEAVNDLDRRTAEVELEIRKKADADKQKLTIPEVTALVASNKELADLKAVVVEKNKKFLKLDGKVKALEHKRSMIESAVRMVVSKSMGISTSGVANEYAEDESVDAIRRSLNSRGTR